jgi:hypothetical protein
MSQLYAYRYREFDNERVGAFTKQFLGPKQIEVTYLLQGRH